MALLKSLQCERPNVAEFGGFLGHTSLALAQAIPVGTLTIAEYDTDAPERAQAITDRLLAANLPDTLSWRVLHSDALTVIGQLADESLDFAYLDDDHTPQHVAAEIDALLPKMRPNSLITGHDCFGVCELHKVFTAKGGYALDLPKLGPAGGLGIIQVR